MALDERLADFIGQVYENAHDEPSWDLVTRGLMDFTQSRFILVTLIDARTCDASFSQGFGADDSRVLKGIEDLRSHRYVDDPSLAFARDNPLARYCDSRPLADSNPEYMAWYRNHFRTDYWWSATRPSATG